MKYPTWIGIVFLFIYLFIAQICYFLYRASRVSLDTIQKTLKQMDSNIKNLQQDVTNNRVPQSEDDHFAEIMDVSFVFNQLLNAFYLFSLTKSLVVCKGGPRTV